MIPPLFRYLGLFLFAVKEKKPTDFVSRRQKVDCDEDLRW
jgi:hypothetical protein